MKILFISHDSSFTGAPILLVQLIEWMKNTKHCEVGIIIMKDGPLTKEFKKLGEVLLLKKSDTRFNNLIKLIVDKIYPLRFLFKMVNDYKVKRFTKRFNPDLVYANTVVSLKIIEEILKVNKYPVVCHVHELKSVIEECVGADIFSSKIKFVNKIIACAKIVKTNLVNTYSIPDEKITVINEHIRFKENEVKQDHIFFDNKIISDDFLVVGAGQITYRKGVDLFIKTAFELKKLTSRNFKFIWIGKIDNDKYFKELTSLIEKLGLSEILLFLGFKEKPIDYFSKADVFFLSSREDPYPLVCLEAASQGKPIICFDKCGGITDFVEENAGIIVSDKDCKEAAFSINNLMNNKDLKFKLGNNAKDKAYLEASIETTGPKIWAYINSLNS